MADFLLKVGSALLVLTVLGYMIYMRFAVYFQNKNYKSRIAGARGELAELLGTRGITDESFLRLAVDSWVDSPDKNKHLVGINADLILHGLQTVKQEVKYGNYDFARQLLESASNNLGSLKIQIKNLEPQL